MRIEEIVEGKSGSVHEALIKLGLKDITDKKMKYIERRYNANHDVQDIHKALIANGFEMVTHYKSDGKPFPKYKMYEDPKMGGGRCELHEKNGKIFYVVFDYRQSHD